MTEPFNDLTRHSEQQQLIAVINDRLRYFENEGYSKVLSKLAVISEPRT